MASGEVVIGLYPPGYSALLAPLVWIWPHDYLALRLLSLAFYMAAFPLLWIYLGRHGVDRGIRSAALTVLALGPPFATYATMVMAETPFIVALLLLLMAVDRWREEPRAVTWTGLEVVVLAAGLIWLKQAAIGLVAGLALWWPISGSVRRWAKAGVLLAGVGLSLVPVVGARAVAGVPLAGARYSQELGGFYQGGLIGRLVHVLPASTLHLFATAVPATLVPYLEPLPIQGHWPDLWKVLSWHVTVLIAVGAVAWFRRYRDAAVPMAVAYLAEAVLWPFVNERRAILVLPLLVTWYVLGGVEVWAVVRRFSNARRATSAVPVVTWALGAALVAGPLLAQAPRNYLYSWGASSSRFGGARYDTLLSHLGRPAEVVETDYRSAIGLFTGHASNWSAFIYNQGSTCEAFPIALELIADRADYLVVGDFNKPGVIDNPCLQTEAPTFGWVELLHTATDDATVYELIGTVSGHPGTADVLLGQGPGAAHTSGDYSSLTWTLPGPTPVSQITLGQAAAGAGPTRQVQIEVEHPDGSWVEVAGTAHGVGDGPGNAPFLLDRYTGGPVIGVRVGVYGTVEDAGAVISDLAVIGPSRSAGAATKS